MKMIELLFLMVIVILLVLPLINADGGDIEFGTNYSTSASDYIVYDRFNRTDNDVLGNALTGQAWTEAGIGNAQIKDNMLYKTTVSHVKLTQNLSSTYTDIFTVDVIYRFDPGTDTTYLALWTLAEGYGMRCGQNEGVVTNLHCYTGSVNVDASPIVDWWTLTDTTVLIRMVVDTGVRFNATFYNMTATNGIITLKTLATLSNTSSSNIGLLDMINVYSEVRQTNVTEIAIYNGTTRPTGVPPSDTTSPIINATLNISTIRINNVVNITANATDETGLSGCQFIENMTLNGKKTYTNISISGTSAQCSNKYTISLVRGNVINFTVIANDTSNNLRMNDTIKTVANTLSTINNVSMTELPIEILNNIKGHWNYSDADGDLIQYNETYWEINGTIPKEARNQTILLGANGNVTNNANISFHVRVYDSYDWSVWNNTINITVGDLTSPSITNISTQNITSFITTDKINITATITDVGVISSTKLYINKSDVLTEYNLIYIGNNLYQISPVDTFALGTYNIAYINATDGSSNKAQENSTISFTVSNPPSDGGTPTGGGGGGKQAPEIINQTIIKTVSSCGNTICEAGEYPRNCPEDCKLFSFKGIFCMPLFSCGAWRQQWFIQFVVIGLMLVAVYTQYKVKKTKRPI